MATAGVDEDRQWGRSLLGWSKSRIRWIPTVPLVILSVIILLALFAPVLTDYSPVRNDLANRLIPPFWVDGGNGQYPLGTDGFGRDVLTRLLYGARVSMAVAIFALTLSVVIATVVGIAAGYLGGWIDSALMRLVDVMLALPDILVGIVVAVILGPSFRNLVLVLGLLTWPRIARLIRGEVLALKRMDFVEYASAIGVPGRLVAWRHLLPNVLATLLIATTLQIGQVILSEAALSFLGAGIPPPQASWGVLIADGQALVSTGWWIVVFPGVAIGITVISSNALGDWLRDRYDPKTRDL